MPADDRLIVALDHPTVEEARAVVKTLGNAVSFYKVGLELLFAGGLDLARQLKAEGYKVFLDFKLLDIGNTVERAVANAATLGADMLTVHAHNSKTLRAAASGAAGTPLQLLGVTVQTNLTDADLREEGIHPGWDIDNLPLMRARMAREAGFHGVVSSGRAAAGIRKATSSTFLIVTPGIRLPGGEKGDQHAITTPAQAIGNGASHIVVGRPITTADDPLRAVWAYRAAMPEPGRA